MPDHRPAGKVTYPLDEMLLLCPLAVLAGAAPSAFEPSPPRDTVALAFDSSEYSPRRFAGLINR